MNYFRINTRRLLPFILWVWAAVAHGQTADQGESGDAGESGLPDSQASIYDTLVFDRPIWLGGGELAPDLATEPAIAAEDAVQQFEERARSIQEFEAAVGTLEAAGGAWNLDLAETLASMGDLYTQQSAYEQAVDAYTRSVHVSRVNLGLDNQQQLPVVEDLIASYLALGDWEKADQFNNYLYYTQKKTFGLNDPRMIPALDRMARWNLSVFKAGWGEAVGLRLPMAFYMFRGASRIVSTHFGENDPRYVQFLNDSAGAAYLVARYQAVIAEATRPEHRTMEQMLAEELGRIEPATVRGFREGLLALERIVEIYSGRDQPQELARALINLGDWQLLFDRRRAAEQYYGQAYALFAGLPDGARLIQENFSIVKTLPEFSPAIEEVMFTTPAASSSRTASKSGHVDLQFDVTPYGVVTNLQTVSEETAENSQVISILRRMVRQTVFRPVVEAGALVRADGNRLRYRYWY